MIDDSPADDPLGAVINAYLDARHGGQDPDRTAFYEAHPDLAPDLERFFAAHDAVERLSRPLRDVARAARLIEVGDDSGSSSGSGTVSRGLLATPLEFGDYVLLEVLGSGGMGIVYRAHHRELNRDVALKQIITGPLASEIDVQRFRNEAQAAASLEHPNIVPVHEVGERDGRHYLTMRLMEGGSLAAHLKDYEADPRASARLLAAVAHAVHHAHQRGILHRDLKPSNILLDRASAPHVTDFGLARRVGEESTLTGTDVILGTPSYMAPEQAAGRAKEITTATDVYGLGAILYALLTARAPFRSDSVQETLHQVQERAPVPLRKLNPSVPRELEVICQKCLEKEPRRRYGSAEALADDLDRWLEGKPITARRISSAKRLWMWCRRNPVVAGAISLAASALVAVAVLSFLYARHQVRAAERIARERDRAEKNWHTARQAVDDMLTGVAEHWLPYEPRMEAVRKQFLEKARDFYQKSIAEIGTSPSMLEATAKAWSRLGRIHHSLGRPDGAEPALRQAVGLFEQLAASAPNVEGHQAMRLEGYLNLAGVLKQLGRTDEAEVLLRETLSLANKLADEFPRAAQFRRLLATCSFDLANLLREAQRLTEAEMLYKRTVSLLEQLEAQFAGVADYRRELAKCRVNLGIVFAALRRYADAEREFHQAADAFEKLSSELPPEPSDLDDLATASLNLGATLRDTGRLAGAESAARRAITLTRKLADDFPATPRYRATLATHLINLAGVLADSKRPREAEQAYRESAGIRAKLAAEHPSVPDYRMRLAAVQNELGVFLATAGRLSEAETPLRSALEQSKKLESQFPREPGYEYDLAGALHNLAELINLLGRPTDARELMVEAIDHEKAALKLRPEDSQYLDRLRSHHEVMAEILIALGEHDKAGQSAEKAISVLPEDWQSYYHIAVRFASAVSSLEKDSKLSVSRRKELIQSCAERAIKRLGEAVEKGFKDVKALKEGTEFEALRGRTEFKAVVEKLEATQAAGRGR
jgi:serine/threonine-protein kinase